MDARREPGTQSRQGQLQTEPVQLAPGQKQGSWTAPAISWPSALPVIWGDHAQHPGDAESQQRRVLAVPGPARTEGFAAGLGLLWSWVCGAPVRPVTGAHPGRWALTAELCLAREHRAPCKRPGVEGAVTVLPHPQTGAGLSVAKGRDTPLKGPQGPARCSTPAQTPGKD